MWTWDGQCWAEVPSPGDDPGAEAGYGFVTYDTDRQQAILFGGTDGQLRHMWAWETGRWNFLGTSPAMLWEIAGAVGYDAARHDFVVQAMPPAFQQGPHDPRDFSTETWLWDGGNGWQQVHPATKAPLFFSPNMIFDADSRTVLALGPADFSRTAVLDFSKSVVWSWDGTDWRLLPGSIPSGSVTLVDGGDLGVLAVERGRSLALPSQPPRVFRFQGGQWTSVGRSSVGPSVVFVPAYDPVRKQLVAFGDQFRVSQSGAETFTHDTWTWTPAAGWSKHAGPAPTPSPTPVPFPTPTPCVSSPPLRSFATATSSASTLALVKLRGSDQIVVRDITNIDSPATVATLALSDSQMPAFVGAAEIAAINQQGVIRMPLSGTAQVQAVSVCPGYVEAYDWSRDGQSLTYLNGIIDTTRERQTLKLEWHLVSAGIDRVIGTAPGWVLGIDCGFSEVDDYRVAFSPDGRYVSLVENFCGGVDFQVRKIDGALVTQVKVSDQTMLAPTMGVWSGTTLYFRDSKGVEAWKDGAITPFLPGVAWIRPKASPVGAAITYSQRRRVDDDVHQVYIVDTGTRNVVQLSSQPRLDPVFLSPRYVWYVGMQPCTGVTCAYGGGGPLLTGNTYIYDLPSGTEVASKITAVYDVWPRGS